MGIPRGQKGTCKQTEAKLQSWATSGALWNHTRGLHLGREHTWTPWINSGKVEAWKNCLSEGGKEDTSLLSLVVHQGLDFVHQLTCYLQDMLDVVTLGHLCRSDRCLSGTWRNTNRSISFNPNIPGVLETSGHLF